MSPVNNVRVQKRGRKTDKMSLTNNTKKKATQAGESFNSMGT